MFSRAIPRFKMINGKRYNLLVEADSKEDAKEWKKEYASYGLSTRTIPIKVGKPPKITKYCLYTKDIFLR